MSEALERYEAPTLPQNLEEVQAFGRFAKQAGLIPKEVNEFQAAAIIQAGREMGLAPLQSLRCISFVNGRLVMKVELLLALARRLLGVVLEDLEEGPDYCTVTLRRGDERVTTTFSDEDAKRAGLLNKAGAWAQYPRTMRRWRSIGDGLRLIAPEVTMGFLTPEEAESIALTFEPEAVAKAVAEAECTTAGRSEARQYTAQEVRVRLQELGFSQLEQVSLRSAIHQAKVDPQEAARIVMQAESRQDALDKLGSLGVGNPFDRRQVSAAAGSEPA